MTGWRPLLSRMVGPMLSCLSHFSIVMVQTSEDGMSYHLGSNWRSSSRGSQGVRDLLLDPLMRPGLVEVVYIRIEHALELLLLQDEHVIEALASHTAQKAFTNSIGSRGVVGRFEDLDVTRFGNPVEGHPKLAIIISDEVLWSHPKGRGFPKLLCRPRVSGRACHADVDHSA